MQKSTNVILNGHITENNSLSSEVATVHGAEAVTLSCSFYACPGYRCTAPVFCGSLSS